MLDWELWIMRGQNGFIVRWMEELENGTVQHLHRVFESDEEEFWGDHKSLVRCLQTVAEHFGLLGSKHDGMRVEIRLAKGGEHE